MNIKDISVLIVLMVVMCGHVKAEPIVIYDSGRTVPASKYTNFLFTDIKPDFIKSGWMFTDEADKEESQKKPNSQVFPLTTKLSPARISVNKEQYIASLPGPLGIVGSDPLSKQWITRNYKHLRDMGARCIIVQSENESQAQELAMMLNGLLVNLGDGDVLADYFKIEHYPVLITERSISQ